MIFIITTYLLFSPRVDQQKRGDYRQLLFVRPSLLRTIYLFAVAVALAMIAVRSAFNQKVPPREFATPLPLALALFLKNSRININPTSRLSVPSLT